MPKGGASKKVDKRDSYRVLLTEVLPYEVPLWFTNDYFHDECRDGRHESVDEPLGMLCSILRNSPHIPYSYWVIRDEGDVRELSVMHPLAQLGVVDFYEEYNEIVLHFCSRSQQSLRAPSNVVSRFYEGAGGDQTPQGVEEEDREKSYCSSYFTYRKYAFLYPFFESYDYHSLEKRFRHMHQVDIESFFASIYTHTVSWAVKSKVFAKKTRRPAAGFDTDFDDLMMNMNYGETNGILVGPEVSRIFAEVILQEVDARLVRAMEQNLRLRVDYDFRRFVDDYFIFASDHEDCEHVVDELSRILAEFKLHLNPMKRGFMVRPFISQLSLCKLALSKEIDGAFDSRWTGGETSRLQQVTSPSRLANKIIVDVKSAVKRFSGPSADGSVSYKSISNYFLSGYTRKIRQDLERYEPARDGEKAITAYLLVDLDVIFFVYSMDLRVRPTDWIARLVQMVIHFVDGLSEEPQHLVRKKVLDLTRHAIDVSLGVRERVSFVEIQNMLLVLSLLGEDFLLEESYLSRVLKGFLQREPQANRCSYFMWVTLMLYIRDFDRYDGFRSELVERMLERFEGDDYCLESAELFMLFADVLTCPWVEKQSKKRLLALAASRHSGLPVKETKQGATLRKFCGTRLFVDWNDTDWASKRLVKKKHAYPYEQ